jgi:ATP-binding cassette subfamily B protein
MDLLNESKDIIDKPDAVPLRFGDGTIEFDNVKFSYDGKQDTLKGISFKIKSGQNVALGSCLPI